MSYTIVASVIYEIIERGMRRLKGRNSLTTNRCIVRGKSGYTHGALARLVEECWLKKNKWTLFPRHVIGCSRTNQSGESAGHDDRVWTQCFEIRCWKLAACRYLPNDALYDHSHDIPIPLTACRIFAAHHHLDMQRRELLTRSAYPGSMAYSLGLTILTVRCFAICQDGWLPSCQTV
jgi:hypothetical protein